tara:strand:- start:65 stop:232 length:168 start_codon:yes stop_codon:yes gene_type:complete
MANKLTIGLGLLMVLFATSMQDTINNPMSNAVFALQIALLMAGICLAIYGARRSK